MTMIPPKFCIYGAGAVGGTIATLLAKSGAEVSVVVRGETLRTIKQNGLQLNEDGHTSRVAPTATDDPRELGPQDYVIVAVKAPSLIDVAEKISPLLGPDTTVVTAMNGVPWWFLDKNKVDGTGESIKAVVDPDGLIRNAIPANRAVGCVVYMACSIDAPGIINHRSGKRLIVGEPDNNLSVRLRNLVMWLNRSGFDCDLSSNIQTDIWVKLWGNLSLNPISLLTAETSDKIMNDPLVYNLCVKMMDEAAAVGAAFGIPVALSADEMMGRARALGAFKTSMLQDMERGKQVEIDALLQVAHDMGQRAGVPTPFIDSILGLARVRARGLGLFESAA